MKNIKLLFVFILFSLFSCEDCNCDKEKILNILWKQSGGDSGAVGDFLLLRERDGYLDSLGEDCKFPSGLKILSVSVNELVFETPKGEKIYYKNRGKYRP